MDDLVASHDLNEDDDLPLETVNTLVDQLVKEVQNTSEAVEKEDRERQPYTLDPVRTDYVKIPTFEGRDDDDFC